MEPTSGHAGTDLSSPDPGGPHTPESHSPVANRVPVVAVVVAGPGRLYAEALARLLAAHQRWSVREWDPDQPPGDPAPAVVVVVSLADPSLPAGSVTALVEPAGKAPVVLVVDDATSWSLNHPEERSAVALVLDASAPASALVETVSTILAGDVDRGSAGRGRARPAPSAASVLSRLTRREAEILRLAAAGAPTPRVAAHLGISSDTVRTHLQSCMAKLDAHSRTELVSVARAAGLEPDPAGRRLGAPA